MSSFLISMSLKNFSRVWWPIYIRCKNSFLILLSRGQIFRIIGAIIVVYIFYIGFVLSLCFSMHYHHSKYSRSAFNSPLQIFFLGAICVYKTYEIDGLLYYSALTSRCMLKLIVVSLSIK